MILTVQSDIVHHFEDVTNLLNYNNLWKRMNKQVNQGLKNFINWPNSNKNYLYIKQMLFHSNYQQNLQMSH